MGNKTSPELRKVSTIESPFVPTTLELLASPAWRAQSINSRRPIDFLTIEPLKQAGQDTGDLRATYAQLEECGTGRRFIHDTITEAEALGLVRAVRGGRRGFTETALTRFRLTFVPDKTTSQHGV